MSELVYQFTRKRLVELRTELTNRQTLYFSKSRVGKTQLHLDAIVQQLYFLDGALRCAHMDSAERILVTMSDLGMRKAARIVNDTDDTPQKVAAFFKTAEMLFSSLTQSFESETKWYRALLEERKAN